MTDEVISNTHKDTVTIPAWSTYLYWLMASWKYTDTHLQNNQYFTEKPTIKLATAVTASPRSSCTLLSKITRAEGVLPLHFPPDNFGCICPWHSMVFFHLVPFNGRIIFSLQCHIKIISFKDFSLFHEDYQNKVETKRYGIISQH